MSSSAAGQPLRASTLSEQEQPLFPSTAYLGWGLVLVVVATLVLGYSLGVGDGEPITLLLGGMAGIAGQIMLAIGVIAKGVKLGIRES